MDLIEAHRLSSKADPISAFGYIVVFNTEVNEVINFCLCDYISPTNAIHRKVIINTIFCLPLRISFGIYPNFGKL